MLLPRDLDRDAIIDRVVELTSAAREPVERASRATLAVLAAWDPEHERDPVAFYRRVAENAESGVGVALEHAELVLRAIAEMLPFGEREQFLRQLPDTIQRHVRAPAHTAHRPERHHLATGHALASGRPGSRHPISDSHPERAQSHSVARSPQPHGDTQLSTSHGVKKAPNLAEGKPGSERSISEDHGK